MTGAYFSTLKKSEELRVYFTLLNIMNNNLIITVMGCQ